MKIAAVSDVHGRFDSKTALPSADVLVIAGDYCPNFRREPNHDTSFQLGWLQQYFVPFLEKYCAHYKEIIIVAGNHDWAHERAAKHAADLLAPYATYLMDSSVEVDGVKFYGSPWTPWFYEWAFQFGQFDPANGHKDAVKAWAKIPDKTDVLITHGPPLNILDLAPGNRRVGCPILRDRVFQVSPKLHLFGHIHGSYGVHEERGIRFGNVALCDEMYHPTQPIQVFEI